jgi:xanthine dehydrogenase YagT iron-sulfur-binding subunit
MLPREKTTRTELPMPLEMSRREFISTASAAGVAGVSTPLQQPAGPLDFAERRRVALAVNGQALELEVESRMSLLDLLRESLSLTGAKKGCNEGACGACTVLVDGRRMNSCLTLAVQCHGRRIVTAEGLSRPGEALHPVQQAFIDHDAFQCGYCTPGQVVSAVGCIAEGHARDEAQVREWMSGNLCRCSAYPQITAAVLDAAGRMPGRG